MAQATTEVDEAIAAAKRMESGQGKITHDTSNDNGRHNFRYDDGAVHAHILPDGWEIIGFGTGWFSIRLEESE